MKTYLGFVTALALLLTLPASAQRGPGGPPAPNFGGAMSKYFGDNSNFSARMEMQTKDDDGNTITMPGKFAFSEGKARFEMNMGEIKGSSIPPQAVAQMKAMGMDRMTVLSLPEKKSSAMIYPGLKAYLEVPFEKGDSANDPKEDYKLELTEIGKETVDGHPCVKNKAVVTDKEGKKQEATIWSATDLKKFPVKIEQTENGQKLAMFFKDVQLTKPDASLFTIPAELKKYESQQEMMMDIMSRQGGFPGAVPKR
jgi:outer membrane lipoprotein-sorting protein